MNRKPTIAIIYDFDKTLATKDMQEFTFIPNLGIEAKEFWSRTGELSQNYGVEQTLAYLYQMILECKKKNIPLTAKYLNECGKLIEFFPGVREWFTRINQYGKDRGVTVQHYVISSGNKEIIKGCDIYKCFKATFGCEFFYSETTKEALWPKNVVNFTMKTQYLFRISKKLLDDKDAKEVNKKREKPIPFTNMIYIGDGITDVPCMEIIKNAGGHSIALTSKDNKSIAKTLGKEDRVQFICKPDYSKNSLLDKTVKSIINVISNQAVLTNLNKKTVLKEK